MKPGLMWKFRNDVSLSIIHKCEINLYFSNAEIDFFAPIDELKINFSMYV